MAAILVLSILKNPSYFQLNAFKPGIYRFSGSASLLALSVSYAIQTEDIAAILILSLIFYYWHNVFRVTASAEGCLSTCTVFFKISSIRILLLYNNLAIVR